MPFTLLALLFCKCCSRMEFLALKRSVAEATCRFESYRVPKVLCIGGGTGRRRGLKECIDAMYMSYPSALLNPLPAYGVRVRLPSGAN